MGRMKSEWHLSIAYEVAESLESVQKKDLRITSEMMKMPMR